MLTVRIIKNYTWDGYEILRQTPKGDGVWGDIRFTLDPVETCDYAIVLNYTRENVQVTCPPGNVWAIMQEPNSPELMPWLVEGHEAFARVYTPHAQRGDPKYIATQTCLPWFDHDRQCSLADLHQRAVPEKTRTLSWVTSSINYVPGHQPRLSFLNQLQQDPRLPIDLFGRGISPIPNKWDAIAPYKYSLAIENSSSPHYWTEKVADCFLAYTLPIYYGCTNLDSYFSKDAFIAIDIHNYEASVATILDAIHGKAWEHRFEAIRHAREQVLNQYQLFPFLADQIAQHQGSGAPERVQIKAYRGKRASRWHRLLGTFARHFSR